MADGISYPQIVTPQQQNPLQTIGALQGLEQRQQAMELQQQQNTAKLALGQLMQQHIDPETGELKAEDMLVHAATVPEIRPIMSEVMSQMLANKHVEAQILGQKLSNKAQQLDMNSGIASAIYEQQMRKGQPLTKDTAKQVASDFVTQQIAAGTLERGKAATDTLLGLTKQIDGGANINDMLRTYALSAPKGVAGLQAAGLTLKDLMAPEVTTQGGVKGVMPRYATPLAPPGVANLIGQQAPQTTAEGTSAPRSGSQVGQGESPSASPATNFLPTESTPEMEQRTAYIKDTKGEHWLRKRESEAEDDANKAANFETTLHQQADLLKNFEQGPLMDTRIWTAEKLSGLGLSPGMVDTLMGAKGKGMDAVAAAQAARKALFEETANALRTQLPGMSRFTNFDLQQALKAIPTMETKKEAAEVIYKHLLNAVNIAKESAEFTGRYADWSTENFNNKRAFKQRVLDESLRDYLVHKGLHREGPITLREEGK